MQMYHAVPKSISSNCLQNKSPNFYYHLRSILNLVKASLRLMTAYRHGTIEPFSLFQEKEVMLNLPNEVHILISSEFFFKIDKNRVLDHN